MTSQTTGSRTGRATAVAENGRQAAADGDALIAPAITSRLLQKFADVATDPRPLEPVDPLSEREEETLLEVAQGLTTAEIDSEQGKGRGCCWLDAAR